MDRTARFFIARHGETVFNAAARMQGGHLHTPLTRAGFAQADEMGEALKAYLERHPGPPPTLWASDAGRALQTLAVVAEHIGADWHQTRVDTRLREIDLAAWGGRSYADVIAEGGPLLDPATGLFSRTAPGGEWYDQIAARLSAWLTDTRDEPGDRLIIMHGLSSRVLRGVMTGIAHDPVLKAGVAAGLPQGSMVMIADGAETVIHRGRGRAPA
ncbi:MAG: histidine phosphatase family protein [Sphingobium sp.]